MHLQVEYFSNNCEDINDNYLSLLSDPQTQKRIWIEKKTHSIPCVDFVELLLGDLKQLFTTSEYKYYSSSLASKFLKELFEKIEGFYSNIETASKFSNGNKLLNDSKWIEIQDLSRKTEAELKMFINQIRKIMM